MSISSDDHLLAVLLDSWDRNNRILVNLLEVVPDAAIEARVLDDSMSIVRMFTHMHFTRALFAYENAPELTDGPPSRDVFRERDRARIADMLNHSARIVRVAVKSRIESGRPLDRSYDHPLLFLQHMIWHEGYHHGQIKLAMRKAGVAVGDDRIGPLTWDLWDQRTETPPTA